MIYIKRLLVCCMTFCLVTSMFLPSVTFATSDSTALTIEKDVILSAMDKEKLLNLYEEKNVESEILTQISSDTMVKVVEEHPDFILVDYKDEETNESCIGYISLSDLESYEIVEDTEVVEEETDIETDIETAVKQDTSNLTVQDKEEIEENPLVNEEEQIKESPIKEVEEYSTSESENENLVSDVQDEVTVENEEQESVRIASDSVKLQGIVSGSSANIYESTSGQSKSLKEYTQGSLLLFYNYSDNWYTTYINVNGVTKVGYILKKQVELVDIDPVKEEGFALSNPTKVYSSPSLNSEVVRTFFKGTMLKFYTYTSTWYKSSITINGKARTIYIHKNDIEQPTKKPVKYEGKASANPTNMYESPSRNSSVLKKFDAGSTLKYYTYTSDWFKSSVTANGETKVVYIHKDDVEQAEISSIKYEGIATAKPTKIYEDTSTNSTVYKEYPEGSLLKFYDYSYDWYRTSVNVNGTLKTGYILKSQVDLIDLDPVKNEGIAVVNPTKMYSSPSRDAKVVKTYATSSILKYYTYTSNWYKSSVNVNGKSQTIYIYKNDVEQATDTPKKYEGIAVANPTKMYSTPSRDAKVVKTYATGSILKYYTYTSEWYSSSVNVNGKSQTIYIHKNDIEQATNSPVKYEGIALANPTKMYSSASRNAKYYKTFQAGSILKYYTYSANWYRSSVAVNGENKTVYIYKNDIEVVARSSQVLQGIALKNPTNIYSLPFTSQKVVKYYSKGKILKYYNFSANWYTSSITINGKIQTIYIKKSDVGNQTLSNYGISLSRAVSMQMATNPQTDIAPLTNLLQFSTRSMWNTATSAQVEYYLNPNNFDPNSTDYFQFLILSSSAGTNIAEVNSNILKGKGVLEGKASSFINAAKNYNINEIYLISHSLLETGNGTSKLATGIEYNGKKVFNVYGIGAYDSDPEGLGAKYAYEQGWFTVEDAIIGGAKFVAKNYIHAGQDTLYEMRWNPDAMVDLGYAYHQYASDIGWAVKQTTRMAQMYSQLSQYSLIYDVPEYIGL